jgi:hypothetical protein
MLRWSDEELSAYQATRQGRVAAKAEAKQHVADAPRAKYRNKKTVVDGQAFDSKAEAARYVQLKKMAEANIIFNLQCQTPYDLVVNGVKVCRYVADFVYVDTDGNRIVEDVKGVRTAVYALKAKLMKACLGITIHEIKVARKSKVA